MSPYNQKQVIYLIKSPLSLRDFKRFGVQNWIDHGWKVKVFDITRFLNPKFWSYLDGDKFDILKDGEKCCEKLGVDFDEVYKRTNTSYKPDAQGRSDYKSASSVERIEAFIKLGRKDPVEYIGGWETAKIHAEQLLYDWAADKGRD